MNLLFGLLAVLGVWVVLSPLLSWFLARFCGSATDVDFGDDWYF